MRIICNKRLHDRKRGGWLEWSLRGGCSVDRLGVADQDALKPKFPGREIKAFTASANIRFSCLNEGYIDAPVLPGLKLTHCRLAE